MNFEYIDRDMIVICVKFWYDWFYQFTGFFCGSTKCKAIWYHVGVKDF